MAQGNVAVSQFVEQSGWLGAPTPTWGAGAQPTTSGPPNNTYNGAPVGGWNDSSAAAAAPLISQNSGGSSVEQQLAAAHEIVARTQSKYQAEMERFHQATNQYLAANVPGEPSKVIINSLAPYTGSNAPVVDGNKIHVEPVVDYATGLAMQAAIAAAPKSEIFHIKSARVVGDTQIGNTKLYTIVVSVPEWPGTYQLNCPRIPLHIGDYIAVPVRQDGQGVLNTIRIPLTTMPMDRDSIISMFSRALYKRGQACYMNLYLQVSTMARGEINVPGFMTTLAEQFHWNKDNMTIKALADNTLVQSEDVVTLLTYWRRHRNLRQLKLLGLTEYDENFKEAELKKLEMPATELYDMCMANPYRIPAIPLEKADRIMFMQGIKGSQRQRICGAIVRQMLYNMEKSGWVATPEWALENRFTFSLYEEELIADYNVVVDKSLGMVYLKFAYDIEMYIAQYITRLRLADPIDYDTPLDIVLRTPDLVKEDGTIVPGKEYMAQSAQFTRPDCSPDQVKAVTGALNNRVSIITGGAGTGKCLAPATLIRMADHRLIEAGQVGVGDRLLGPDGAPRIVVSTTQGRDQMYRIVPCIGESFVCNGPHLLTLRGRVPKIARYWDVVAYNRKFSSAARAAAFCSALHHPAEIGSPRWIVKYTVRGNNNIQACNNEAEAQTYLNTLGDDIYEMSVNDYMCQPPKYATLWHAPLVDNEFTRGLIEGKRIVDPTPFHIRDIMGCGWSYTMDGKDIVVSRAETSSNTFMVQPQGEGPYVGFQLMDPRGAGIDGPEPGCRFVLADYLVTHNTTIAEQLEKNLKRINRPHLFCSFMGKAVDCLQAKLGNFEPTTIHRALGRKRKSAGGVFTPSFEGETELPDKIDHIVIDECSTADAELVARLLHMFQPDYLTLIGDINQLEPIKWGAFMSGLKLSERIPVYFLSENHRIFMDPDCTVLNGIMQNIICISERDMHDSDFRFEITDDFRLHPGDETIVYKVVNDLIREGVAQKDMVVIVPYKKSLANINNFIQQAYNGRNDWFIDSRNKRWHIGDIVMNKKNNDDKKVYNGTSGVIMGFTDKEVTVRFDRAGDVVYLREPSQPSRWQNERSDSEDDKEMTMRSLDLGSCITVNKAQGIERPYVMYFIPPGSYDGKFLNRNRSYVAFSRAQKRAYGLGDMDLHLNSCHRNAGRRIDNLRYRLEAMLPTVIPVYTIHTHKPKKVTVGENGVVETVAAPPVVETDPDDLMWEDDGYE